MQSAWLIPYGNVALAWMVPAAALALLVPCLLASVLVERLYLGRAWPEVPKRRLWVAVLFANLASYLLLAIYWGVRLLSSLA